MNLLKFLRRSVHVTAPVIQPPVMTLSTLSHESQEIRPACPIDPQLLREQGLPPWLTTEEAAEAMAEAPSILRDHPAPVLTDEELDNAVNGNSVGNIYTPAAVMAPSEIIVPVTYSTDPALQEKMLFSEHEATRLPIGKRHRPVLGLGLSFSEDGLMLERGSSDWFAVQLQHVTFEMILDRNHNPQTRVNNTEMYTVCGVPQIAEKTTHYNFSWKNYSLIAERSGRLYEPSTYTKPLTALQVQVNQAMDNPKAAEYIPEPELFLGFNDANTVWEILLPALGCTGGQTFSIQPSKKQLDYVESQILKGMPVYANTKGIVTYVPWKKQASFDIYIEGKDGRVFTGCIPEFGKYYIPEGTEVTAGQLIAAGFPQQADLDGDGQVDSPLTPFVAGQKLSPFLSNNGGFKNVIMTVMKNATRKFGGIVVAPFDTVSRLVERSVPDLALLVWQKNCHSNPSFQVDISNEDNPVYFGVLPHRARRHGFGQAKRGLSRDGLVVSSAPQ